MKKAGLSLGCKCLKDEQIMAVSTFIGVRDVFGLPTRSLSWFMLVLLGPVLPNKGCPIVLISVVFNNLMSLQTADHYSIVCWPLFQIALMEHQVVSQWRIQEFL